jgi:hypothetical protein
MNSNDTEHVRCLPLKVLALLHTTQPYFQCICVCVCGVFSDAFNIDTTQTRLVGRLINAEQETIWTDAVVVK